VCLSRKLQLLNLAFKKQSKTSQLCWKARLTGLLSSRILLYCRIIVPATIQKAGRKYSTRIMASVSATQNTPNTANIEVEAKVPGLARG